MITDLGTALQLKGTPRDPGLVADTASLMALARGGLAGPVEGHRRVLHQLAEVKAWASDMATREPSDLASSVAERRAARTLVRAGAEQPHLGRGPGVARATYVALWALQRKADIWAYLAGRSQARL